MQTSNITNVYFDETRHARTDPLYQWDYGQVLQFPGRTLPTAYEVQFANVANGGETITMIGDEDGVLIPDELLTTGLPIYAWVYLHTGLEDGESEYGITIPILKRPEPSDIQPTPVQQDVITQAIAALNQAVEQTGQDVIDANAAKVAAEAAQGAAEAAQVAAEGAEGRAQGYAQDAAESASSASYDAGAAEDAQAAAEAARDAAKDYADDAADSADKAEQAATNAGYMEFHIDERGHLIYTRTGIIDADFALIDGHLVLEVA